MRRFFRRPGGLFGAVLLALLVLVALFADVIAPGDPLRTNPEAMLPPGGTHPLGTDNLGRDLFLGVVHGTRTSMTVVFWVLLVSSGIGIVVGTVAGFLGSVVDDLLMRLTDLFQAVPRFFMALVVLSLFGRSLENLIVVLSATSWTLLARVIRAETLSMREREFIEAARAAGATSSRILVHHVLPLVLPAGIVIIAMTGSRVILLEATLSFLGLSDQNQISLGMLVSNAGRFLTQAWWLSVFPGMTLVLIIVSLNLLGDAVAQALLPGVRSSGGGRLATSPVSTGAADVHEP